MKRTKSVGFGNPAIAAVMGLVPTLSVQAEIKSRSGNQIVEEPADLPEMAKTPGSRCSCIRLRTARLICTLSSTTVRGLPCSMLPIRQRSRPQLQFQSMHREHSILCAIQTTELNWSASAIVGAAQSLIFASPRALH